jgi:hypothetical protein
LFFAQMNCSAESKAVQGHLLAFRLHTPKTIAEHIRRGPRDGDARRHTSVDALAAYYTAVLHGLSIQARNGASRSNLSSVVDCAMSVWEQMASGT